jgi:hypothetical protein
VNSQRFSLLFTVKDGASWFLMDWIRSSESLVDNRPVVSVMRKSLLSWDWRSPHRHSSYRGCLRSLSSPKGLSPSLRSPTYPFSRPSRLGPPSSFSEIRPIRRTTNSSTSSGGDHLIPVVNPSGGETRVFPRLGALELREGPIDVTILQQGCVPPQRYNISRIKGIHSCGIRHVFKSRPHRSPDFPLACRPAEHHS